MVQPVPSPALRPNFFSRLRNRLTGEGDAGIGLAELIVAIALLGVLFAMGAGTLHLLTRTTPEHTSRVDLWADFQDASGQLLRDTSDGVTIRAAEAQKYSIDVVRDHVCQTRTYEVTGGALMISTAYFEQESCSGPTEVQTKTLIPGYTLRVRMS